MHRKMGRKGELIAEHHCIHERSHEARPCLPVYHHVSALATVPMWCSIGT